MSEPASSAPISFGDDAETDFWSMSKSELLDYASEIGAEGVNSAMKKAEIIAAINQ